RLVSDWSSDVCSSDLTAEFSTRLPAVQRSLYLLFSEGYHSASAEHAIRVELCREAMRLSELLLEHPHGGTPETYALSALMCLNEIGRASCRERGYGEV